MSCRNRVARERFVPFAEQGEQLEAAPVKAARKRAKPKAATARKRAKKGVRR